VAVHLDADGVDVVKGAPVVPRLRAVEADGELVGFLMLAEATADHAEPYLWRLLVDAATSGGASAIGRSPCSPTSCAPRAEGRGPRAEGRGPPDDARQLDFGPGTPEPFYLSRGFVKVRDIGEDEVEGRLTL
jgi:hypothetical protein